MLTMKSHAIIDNVGIFRARQWPGRGSRTNKAARIEPTGIATDMVDWEESPQASKDRKAGLGSLKLEASLMSIHTS